MMMATGKGDNNGNGDGDGKGNGDANGDSMVTRVAMGKGDTATVNGDEDSNGQVRWQR